MKPRQFGADPRIEFFAVMCPMCHNPTGPTSECYKEAPEELPVHGRHVNTADGIPVPIYSHDCGFRRETQIRAVMNYPVSDDLCQRLMRIPGISGIRWIDKYTVIARIAAMFVIPDIKFAIAGTFRAWGKEQQARELDRIGAQYVPNEPIGIQLPNGLVHASGTPVAYKQIAYDLPGSTLIFPGDKSDNT